MSGERDGCWTGVVTMNARKKWSTVVPPYGKRKQHRSKTAAYGWIQLVDLREYANHPEVATLTSGGDKS